MPDDGRLLDALAVIRDRGAIGPVALTEAVQHADRFVAALPSGSHRLADLGSGGGLPGLVIGWRRPDVDVVLIERRTTRADLLRRAISALALSAHVAVAAEDVEEVARREPRSFAVVTARSFADPARTLAAIDLLLAEAGRGLVSEPPESRQPEWAVALARHPDLRDEGVTQGIRRFSRVSLN